MTKAQREQIYRKYDGHCAYCGIPIEMKDMQIDHIKPIFRGWNDQEKEHLPKGHLGDNSIENLNPACRACNFRKGTDDIEGFRAAIEHGLDCCRRDFTYRMMVRYGLVVEHPQKVIFYFEKLEVCNMKTREEEMMEMALAFHKKCIGAPSAENPITYEDAYEQGWKDADEHPKNPWLDAKKELPENNKTVLVWLGGCYKVALLRDNQWWECTGWQIGGGWSALDALSTQEVEYITHWMPIPETPKGGEV